jgi:hypothetical protein
MRVDWRKSVLKQLCVHAAERWTYWFGIAGFYLVAYLYCMSRLLTNVSQVLRERSPVRLIYVQLWGATQVYIPVYVLDTLNMDRSALSLAPLTVYMSSLLYTLYLDKIDQAIGRYYNFMLGWCEPRMRSNCWMIVCVSCHSLFVLVGSLGFYVATHNTSWLVYAASGAIQQIACNRGEYSMHIRCTCTILLNSGTWFWLCGNNGRCRVHGE